MPMLVAYGDVLGIGFASLVPSLPSGQIRASGYSAAGKTDARLLLDQQAGLFVYLHLMRTTTIDTLGYEH
jgi:F0F1-type ATP synthase membrane subunit c/vacuolar-type H+-ATPase subunit K